MEKEHDTAYSRKSSKYYNVCDYTQQSCSKDEMGLAASMTTQCLIRRHWSRSSFDRFPPIFHKTDEEGSFALLNT